ncbi:hypothetical protein HHL19_14200 [Streptomyces sp. R302]|uniref:hypothetical protein n=1 Tax=unclassified Streptomyces TaxID=2593676 RepID=UPI00145D284E|nr:MULTISPECIES: hypothetical protein [unclassified Streptomyces]NML51222.1 hypothetical protein [Streptomyces sp. R301]NML79800.1 hypothetical protein [Streptomyces sp. R302]
MTVARDGGGAAGTREAVPSAPPAAPRDLARLPGPRRHLDRVERDLRAGLDCVWYFPDTVVASGRADFFLRELLHRFDGAVPVPGSVAPPEGDAEAPAPGMVVLPAQRASDGAPDPAPGHVLFDPWHEEDDGFDADDPYGALLGSWAAPPDGIGTGPPAVAETPGTARPVSLVDRLAKELGVAGDPWDELLRRARRGHRESEGGTPDGGVGDDPPGSPPTVVVRGWEEHSAEEMGQLLRAAHATFREAGLPAERRPRFLFAARVDDLPTRALGRGLSPHQVTLHWWWRVWTRLDSEVLLAWRPRPPATAAQALYDRVTDSVVAEVCGPDVDRALVLREVWKGGDVESLRHALTAALPGGDGSESRSWPRRMSTAHASRPSAEILDDWASGVVDSWDGHVRPVVARRLLDPDSPELRILVCHAQNRVLLPLIEEARTSLTELVPGLLRKGIELDYFREQARSEHRVRNRLPAAPLAELEIGDLARVAGYLVLPSDQRDRLQRLSRTRNHLSHLQPLGQEQLVTVTEALTTDWGVGGGK